MIKWFFLFFIFAFFANFAYWSWKFHNPFALDILIGKKGSGKTTLLTKYALTYKKKGWNVYANFEIPGTYYFDASKLGDLMFPEYSLVLIDELGLVFNNRAFKTFRPETIRWFKLQRQYRVRCICCSQADDYDKSIRNLVDHVYLISNLFNCVSMARKVVRTVSIVSAKDGMGESRIVEDLNFTPWFTIPFGGALFTWIPKYTKYFKSFNPPELPLKDFYYYDERTDLYNVTLFNRIFSHLRSDPKLDPDSEIIQDDSEIFDFSVPDPEDGAGSPSSDGEPATDSSPDGSGHVRNVS